MIYLPSDNLMMHLDNADALIEQLTDSRAEDERVFSLIDFLMMNRDKLKQSQRKLLNSQMAALKWDAKYVYQRPHSVAKNPGLYADAVLHHGYYYARYIRESCL